MKFLTDRMLQKLCKWMRFCGIDTMESPDISDDELVLLQQSDSRILLTRDDALSKRIDGTVCLLIRSQDFSEQLHQVVTHYGLDPFKNPFTRCSECNQILQKVDKHSIKDKVPETSFKWKDAYWECPQCERVYWKGTHPENILETLHKIFD